MTSLRCGALVTEYEAAQLISQAFDFLGFIGFAEALCQFEEGLFFLLLCFESLLDECDHDAIVAEAALFGDGFDLLCNLAREGDAATNCFCCCHSGTILHHFGAAVMVPSLRDSGSFSHAFPALTCRATVVPPGGLGLLHEVGYAQSLTKNPTQGRFASLN